MTGEQSILARVHALVETEHGLRARLEAGELTAAEEHDQLRDAEQQLDQAWDLLRRRRAARDNGQDPDAVQARPVGEVEGYSG